MRRPLFIIIESLLPAHPAFSHAIHSTTIQHPSPSMEPRTNKVELLKKRRAAATHTSLYLHLAPITEKAFRIAPQRPSRAPDAPMTQRSAKCRR